MFYFFSAISKKAPAIIKITIDANLEMSKRSGGKNGIKFIPNHDNTKFMKQHSMTILTIICPGVENNRFINPLTQSSHFFSVKSTNIS